MIEIGSLLDFLKDRLENQINMNIWLIIPNSSGLDKQPARNTAIKTHFLELFMPNPCNNLPHQPRTLPNILT